MVQVERLRLRKAGPLVSGGAGLGSGHYDSRVNLFPVTPGSIPYGNFQCTWAHGMAHFPGGSQGWRDEAPGSTSDSRHDEPAATPGLSDSKALT